MTVREVALAAFTSAATPPNRTIFSDGVALNPEPEIRTELPGTPVEGETDVMSGIPPHAGAVARRTIAAMKLRMEDLALRVRG
jgi:hypothetical protein